MDNNFSVKRLLVIIIMLTLIVAGGTFAWFTYQSKESALVLTIGEIDDTQIVLKPYQVIGTMTPVNDYTNGVYSTVEVSNGNDTVSSINLFYKINELDEELIDNGLKYTIVSSGTENGTYTEVKTGDFTAFKGQNEALIYETQVKDKLYYKVYLWLDSSVGDQSAIQNSTLNLELSGSILQDAAVPEIVEGMIPVTISNTGVVTTISSTDEKWYDYGHKKWANIVLVNNNVRSNYEGTTGKIVSESDILAYFVWIPRYKYKLWTTNASETTNPQTINIIFEDKDAPMSLEKTKGLYRTHPAFWFDGNNDGKVDEEEMLAGIWVGKFETTGNAMTPTVLPNTVSIRSQIVSEQFVTSLKFSNGSLNSGTVTFSDASNGVSINGTYGLGINADSHMMKNSEWGAVAYLSHSQYGINEEVRINNSSHATGCGALEENGAATSGCEIKYGDVSLGNYPQSTTGNITGVFDMVGGGIEYVMGVSSDSTGKPNSGSSLTTNSGFNGSTKDGIYSSGIDFPERKYYDLYSTEQFTGGAYTNISLCTLETCGGQASYETAGWYDDGSSFVSLGNPWLLRGGGHWDGVQAGMFYSGSYAGGDDGVARSVIITLPKYTVSYDANGGSGAPNSQTKVYGVDMALSDVIPTRANLTFKGWGTSFSSKQVVYKPGDEYVSNENQTLYAVWSSSNGPIATISSINDNSVKQNVTLSCTDQNGVVGYYFGTKELPDTSDFISISSTKSMNVDETINSSGKYYLYCKNSFEDVSVSANIETFTITLKHIYKYQNTSWKLYKTEKIVKAYGSSFTPANITPPTGYYARNDYNYYDENTVNLGSGTIGSSFTVTTDHLVNIHYVPNEYTISYNGNCTGVASVPSAQNKYYDTPISLSSTVPICAGYTFLGWSTDNNATSATYVAGADYVVNADVTLYGVWEANTHTITIKHIYKYQNTSWKLYKTETTTAKYGSSFTPANITPPTGYYARNDYNYYDENTVNLGSGTIGSSFTVTTDHLVNIHYVPNEYTISYNGNCTGVASVPSAQNKYYDTPISLSSTVPTCIGYTFLGWSTDKNATTATYAAGADYTVNAETTLYAIWEKKISTLTLSATSGTVVKGNTLTFTVKADVAGDFMITSGSTGVAIVSPASIADVAANTAKTITVTGVAAGTSTITIAFAPNDTTYSSARSTYTATITNSVEIPTTDYCLTPIYTGASQSIVKTAGNGFTWTNGAAKVIVGTQPVTASLSSADSRWSDNSTGDKYIYCGIAKATPTITLSATSGSLGVGKTKTFTVTIKSNAASGSVSGTVGVTSSATGKATVTLSSTSISSADNSTGKSVTVTITGVAAGSSTITVTFTPSDTSNYNSATSKTYAATVKTVAEIPTTAYCLTPTYTGSSQTIVKAAGTGYTWTNGAAKTAAGTQPVTATLSSGYIWSDNTTANKYITCGIAKADPTITLSATSGSLGVGKTLTFTEKANVAGTFSNTSGTTSKATVSPASYSSIAANTAKTVTITGVAAGSSTISVKFTPTDTNFNEKTVTYTSTVKTVAEIPTTAYCLTPTYTGSSQTIVKAAGTGYTWTNGAAKTAAGTQPVTATLSSGYIWSDNTTANKYITCGIAKADPTITLSATSGSLGVGKTLTFTEKANVAGTFSNTSGTTSKATVSPASYSSIAANTAKTVTITGVAAGSSTISVKFTPTDTNFNEKTVTYTATVKTVAEIPTTAYCLTPTYTGSTQTIVKTAGTGYTWTAGYEKVAGGCQNTTATLSSGYIWSDNTTGIKQINCCIAKAANTVSVTKKGGTYTGTALALVTFSNAQGTVYYSTSTQLTSSNYSTSGSTTIPTGSPGTNETSKTFTVYWYTPGNTNYNAASGTVSSISVTRQSYTVSYNMCSGTGGPSAQTKYYGITLTLSSTKPTRTGYTFQGWSTVGCNQTSATYSAGGSYTSNSATTLYAVWQQNSPVNATINGQDWTTNKNETASYSTAASYAGHGITSGTGYYYTYILKFTTPAFSYTSSSIKINISMKANNSSYTNIQLRYALLSSDANLSSYQKTAAAVTDANQIYTSTYTNANLSSSTYTSVPFTINTSSISANKTYYLVLWTAHSNAGNVVLVNTTDNHSVVIS